MPTLRTYCTGGDLFGVGAAAAGWAIVDGYELEPKKAAVARLNGHNVHAADVTTLDYAALSPVDHIHTSPSCKTASQANANGGETPADIAVADATVRAIQAHAASGGRSFSLENVWGYRNFQNCFPKILQALTDNGFVYWFGKLNFADYGVPQTRERLIVIGVRRSWRASVQPPFPTHRKSGGLLRPWIGWYEAIADLIDSLKDTQPAPWQAKRLARMGLVFDQHTVIGPNGYEGKVQFKRADEPLFTLAHGGDGPNGNAAQIRACIVTGQNSKQEFGKGYRDGSEPMFTVTATTRPSHAPRMVLMDGSNGSGSAVGVTQRNAHEPAMTLRAGRNDAHRIYTGVWKQCDLRCLARWQTVPATYKGLTAEINGNGVPPKFAQVMMTMLRGDR